MSGSGKTRKSASLIRQRPRVVVFDTLGHDYSDGVVFENERDGQGLKRFKQFWSRCYRDNFRLIYRPFDELSEFDIIAQLAYECGELTFVVEELDVFARPNAISDGLNTIIRRGRHKDIQFVGTSQRPFGIDRIITALATEAYIFKVVEPRDLDYLADRFGSGIVPKIAGLKEYEFVHYRQGAADYEIGKDTL
jgi:DNA helicase HerA-like ATPase